MQEKLLPLDLPPGFVNNGTKYLAKGRWYAGNLVRWRGKTLQPVGGWATRAYESGSATISGVPRAAHAWRVDSATISVSLDITKDVIGLGTTAGLYLVWDDISSGDKATVSDITPSLIAGNDTARYWSLASFGSYLIAVDSGSTVYMFDQDTMAIAVLGNDATAFGTSGPSSAIAAVATPERFLFLLGSGSGVGANAARRTVHWPSQETVTDWTPAGTNTAGQHTLDTTGELRCGRAMRGETLIWTTSDVWSARFVGQPFVYGFTKVGDQCGVVSVNATAQLGTTVYWMGERKFYAYDGYVRDIPCDVEDYVFGNLNTSLNYRVWSLANPQFSEVTWFYASANATDIDSYVTLHQDGGYWTFGSLARMAGVSRQGGTALTGPAMFGSDGAMYDHESGSTHTGATVYAESGPIEIGDGDNVMRVQRIVPDEKTANDVTASLYTSMFPNGTETENGPYTLANPTSVRLTARQVRLKISESVAAAWRVGTVRLGVRSGGRR